MNSEQAVKELRKLSADAFWEGVLNLKQYVKVILDNDETWITTNDGEDYEDEEGFVLHADAPYYLGDSEGIGDLLTALGIQWEHC